MRLILVLLFLVISQVLSLSIPHHPQFKYGKYYINNYNNVEPSDKGSKGAPQGSCKPNITCITKVGAQCDNRYTVCDKGLYCDSTTGQCKKMVATGFACQYPYQCLSEHCRYGLCEDEQYALTGHSCIDYSCNENAYCDQDTFICEPWPIVGEECDYHCSGASLCNNFTCVEIFTLGVGAYCESLMVCNAGLYCNLNQTCATTFQGSQKPCQTPFDCAAEERCICNGYTDTSTLVCEGPDTFTAQDAKVLTNYNGTVN